MNFKKNLSFALVGALLFMASGCGNEGEIDTVSLVGKINGKDWQMKFGKAQAEDIDPGYFSLFLPTETIESNPCDIFLPNTSYIDATLPRKEGTYSLPFAIANQFTFRYPGKFLVPVSGSVEITSITGNTIRGRIDAKTDDNNFVNGSFVLNICE